MWMHLRALTAWWALGLIYCVFIACGGIRMSEVWYGCESQPTTGIGTCWWIGTVLGSVQCLAHVDLCGGRMSWSSAPDDLTKNVDQTWELWAVQPTRTDVAAVERPAACGREWQWCVPLWRCGFLIQCGLSCVTYMGRSSARLAA